MADSSKIERDAAAGRRTRSLRTATALLFSFGCGATTGVSWDYLLDLLA